MKAIIHIGTEKTGTTTIQRFLQNNTSVLRSHGLAVLESTGSFNDRALAAYAISLERFDDFYAQRNIGSAGERERFNTDLGEKVIREITEMDSAIHTVVISSEHFHSRVTQEHELLRLKTLFAGLFDDTQILVYIRPQVDLAISLYSTALRTGESLTLEEFVDRSCRPANAYFNYSHLVRLWGGVFGENALSVRRFEEERLYENDLIKDFLLAISPTLLEETRWQYPERQNESLSPIGQATLRTVNKLALSGKPSRHARSVSSMLISKVEKIWPGAGEALSPHKRLELEQRFVPGNEYVRQRFFPEDSSLF